MKIEIELPDSVHKRILHRIQVVSEREWSEKDILDFMAQDIANVYEAIYEDFLDSAIMDDDEIVRKNLLPSS